MTNSTISTSALTLSTLQISALGIFCFFMTTFGIIGNSTVIYSSLRYNAIRLDKVSLIFVRNLAVADVLYTLCVILPQFITYCAGSWVLGHAYCVVMAQIGIIPASANTLTVLAITAYRLRVVSSPLSGIISTSLARGTLMWIWCVALIPTCVFVAYKSTSEFRQNNSRCLSDIYDNETARIPVMTLVGLIVLLPLFAITICNIALSVIALKHSARRAEVSYRALVMVCALSGLFIVSWSPYLVFTFLKMKSPDIPPSLDLLAFHCIFINSFGNPILYSITNKRFGEYVKGLVLGLCGLKKVGALPQMADLSSNSKNRDKNKLELTSI